MESVYIFFLVYLYQWNLREWFPQSSFIWMDMWLFSPLFIYLNMNAICECFLYWFYIWMESLNICFPIFIYVYIYIYINRIYDVFFIVFVIWMDMCLFSSLFICMNGISECCLHYFCLCVWMESMNIFPASFHMNGICECVLRHLFIWREHSNVFFIVYLYERNLWMFSILFIYMNGISEIVFLIVNLYE